MEKVKRLHKDCHFWDYPCWGEPCKTCLKQTVALCNSGKGKGNKIYWRKKELQQTKQSFIDYVIERFIKFFES